MAKRTLNDRFINSRKPASPGTRQEHMDSIVPGFGVRVTDKGRRTFILIARYPGSSNPTRRALGEYGELNLEQARAKARHWLALLQKGIDPKHEEAKSRAAEERRAKNTFAAVAEDFIKEKLSGERKGKEVERDIRREFIPRWGKRLITDIAPVEVRDAIKAVRDRGKLYQAHNLLGYAKRLFGWAVDQHCYGLETSPCDRLKPVSIVGKRKPRRRILNDAELRAFWRATAKMGYPYGSLFRLMLLTGQRETMVCEAPRAEIDFAHRSWIIPAERMKMENPHLVPLADDAFALFKELPLFKHGAFLLSFNFGKAPIRGVSLSKAKKRLDAAMLEELQKVAAEQGENLTEVKLPPWKLHDLRRTMRSGLSALPIEEHVRELVIAHARAGIGGVYDLYSYQAEKRRALELWEARLRAIVQPPPANVMRLEMARA